MEDDEQNEFVTEQVQDIVKKSINTTLQGVSYTKEKVGVWCNQIVDGCLKSLSALGKPFKYVVTCIIMQKNGAPLHTAATCFWDVKTDGLCCMQVSGASGQETLDCIVTVYACMI